MHESSTFNIIYTPDSLLQYLSFKGSYSDRSRGSSVGSLEPISLPLFFVSHENEIIWSQ